MTRDTQTTPPPEADTTHAAAERGDSGGASEAAGTPASSPIVGIDLGTTNSLVAHCTEAGPRILESPEGRRSLPSVVRLRASASSSTDGAPYTVEAIGHAAREEAALHPARTFHSIKRLMGRSVADLKEDLPHLPYRVVEGPQDTARVVLPPPPEEVGSRKSEVGSGKREVGQDESEADTRPPHPPSAIRLPPFAIHLTPQEVSALILRELKCWADAALGTAVTRAVITVPAYFDDAQRQATRDAGRLAGLEVMRIVNEPTAAALAYGLGLGKGPRGQGAKGPSDQKRSDGTISLNTKLNPAACTSDAAPPSAPRPLDPSAPSAPLPGETIAVYDLGGGTFDISILHLQTTPGTPGNPPGTIDQVLATDGDTHLGGDDLDQLLAQHLLERGSGKWEVGSRKSESDMRPSPLDPQSPTSDLSPSQQQTLRRLAEQTKIALSESESVAVDLTPLALASETSAFRLPPSEFHRSNFESLITPLIQQTLDACRRCLRNAKLTPSQIDRVVLVGGSTRIPLVRRLVSELFGKPAYTALDPDEVVALGASVQAAILAGLKRDTLLLDVIPLSLGIETMGGAVAKLIVANTTLPARASERFSTYVDGQTSVKIHVLQGERELVGDCRSLATFHLAGLPPMPAGLPRLLVTFLVDQNGILSVEALEERSGRRAHVQVVPNHGLTRAEISQIERDSFQHARADMLAHRLIDLRLNARLDIRHIKQQLTRLIPETSQHSPKPTATGRGSDDPLQLDPAYRARLEQHLAAVQTMIDTPDAALDADVFQQALHDLDHASLRLAEINIARTLRDA